MWEMWKATLPQYDKKKVSLPLETILKLELFLKSQFRSGGKERYNEPCLDG